MQNPIPKSRADVVRYVPLDANLLKDPRIMKLRAELGNEGYAIFVMLTQHLCLSPHQTTPLDYKLLKYEIRSSEKKIKNVVENFDLFLIDKEKELFCSKIVKETMEFMEESFKKKSEAGKKAISARWGKDYSSKEVTGELDANIGEANVYDPYTNRIPAVRNINTPVSEKNTIAYQEENTIENQTTED